MNENKVTDDKEQYQSAFEKFHDLIVHAKRKSLISLG
jgi:hypothetical protein